MGAQVNDLMREIKRGAVAWVLLLAMVPALARAQVRGCATVPILTPATLTVSDLRCYPVAAFPHGPVVGASNDRTPLLPLVLGAGGAAAIALTIGFGIGGSSLLGNGVGATPATIDSVRVDYAIANVSLAVGLTALVTAIVLAIVHR